MDHFSISQLQQFSGIKAHTIRMWEQRYNALTPNRSEGNTRYYDNSQLRRLLNIVSLMNGNYRLSELCSMTDDALFSEIRKVSDKTVTHESNEYFISQLIAAGMNYDETHFEKTFSACILRLGLRNTYINVIYPMMTRVGLMWAGNNIPPAQEHFISNIIRQKIFAALDALPPPASATKTWLLFLPENELHETGLLLAHYLIRQAGQKSVYLGSDVPFDTLSSAVELSKAQHLLLFMVHNNNPGDALQYLKTLKKQFPKQSIHVAGNEQLISQIRNGKIFEWFRSITELEQHLSLFK